MRKHGGKTWKELKAAEPVVEAAKPEPPTAEAPDISIHEAAITGNIEAVKKHLAASRDVNAKDKYGSTPLHWAAYSGHKELVELLIANGADVNAKRENGYTPLNIAAGRGHKEVVELLIAKGADLNAKNMFGETPLDAAIRLRRTGTADILLKHGGKTIEELSIHEAARQGKIEAVKQHLAAGTDVNAKDDDGFTPLHYAPGHKEIAELLIAGSAEVNAKDTRGRTPLHYAATVSYTHLTLPTKA